jgi:CRP/FNR family cyclic AMP-dependent transcriptional regulator
MQATFLRTEETELSAWLATSFFGQLSPETGSAMLRQGTRSRVSPGEIIIHEGARPAFAAVLLSGLYKVVGLTEDGRDALLAVRVGGDLVGELGLADGEPRSASVRAASHGEYLRIGERDYHGFLQSYPDANRAASRAMAAKLRSATRRRVEFATSPAPVRVARVLRELAAAHGTRNRRGVLIEVALAQPELAALAGATEATIQRVLTTMREDGIVETGYRRIHILDEHRLGEVAGL